jgi:SET domain-containing protein
VVAVASPPAPGDSPFELRSSPIAGVGAFAIRPIKKGTRIIEYTGERISNAEADRRYDEDKMANHHTFLFTLNRQTVVDAAVGGNEARFINHSCAPNCEAVIEDGRRIYIEALVDIAAGEELVYDYQYERTDDHTGSDERFYACQCGAPTCRGTILVPKKPKRKKPGSRTAGRRVSQPR